MKSIQFFMTLIVFSFGFTQIKYTTTLDEAFAKAKEENKVVFIKYYNQNCSVCKKAQDLLDTKEISEVFNNKFVSFAVDTFDDVPTEVEELFEKSHLNFSSVPMFVFFKNDQTFLHYTGVNVNKESFLQVAKDVFDPYAIIANMGYLYSKGDVRISTLYNYAEYLSMQDQYLKQKEVAQKLFEHFEQEKINTFTSYFVLKKVVNSTENGFF